MIFFLTFKTLINKLTPFGAFYFRIPYNDVYNYICFCISFFISQSSVYVDRFKQSNLNNKTLLQSETHTIANILH